VDFLGIDFAGTPAWMWLAFLVIVVALLVLDLGVLHRNSRDIGLRESLVMSAVYVALGLGFGALVWWQFGTEPASHYVTAFAVEKTLAIDNIFLIGVIFSSFAVPGALQHRVLFWGIVGVIVLRAIMIGLGSAMIAQASWLLYVFALFLVFTGVKMLLVQGPSHDIENTPALAWIRRRLNVTDALHGEKFFVRLPGANGKPAWFVTPLFLALVTVEFADIVFAVDSVPAIFAITTDPFIVYTSNIFAILGLRALYFALAAMVDRFHYLKYALAAVLIFIGSKIFVADLLGLQKFPPMISLSITVGLLAAGVVYSLWRTRRPLGAPAE
jgi:tellurite resistance protein TerC